MKGNYTIHILPGPTFENLTDPLVSNRSVNLAAEQGTNMLQPISSYYRLLLLVLMMLNCRFTERTWMFLG